MIISKDRADYGYDRDKFARRCCFSLFMGSGAAVVNCFDLLLKSESGRKREIKNQIK